MPEDTQGNPDSTRPQENNEKTGSAPRKFESWEIDQLLEAFGEGQPVPPAPEENQPPTTADLSNQKVTSKPIPPESATPNTSDNIPESVPFPAWLESSAKAPEPAETALPNPDLGQVIEPTTPEISSPQQYETWDEILQRVRAMDEAQHALEQNESAKEPEPATPNAESGEEGSSESAETALPNPDPNFRDKLPSWLQPDGGSASAGETPDISTSAVTPEPPLSEVINPTELEPTQNSWETQHAMDRQDFERLLERADYLGNLDGSGHLTFSQWATSDNLDYKFKSLNFFSDGEIKNDIVEGWWAERIHWAGILPTNPLLDRFKKIFGEEAFQGVTNKLIYRLKDFKDLNSRPSQEADDYLAAWKTYATQQADANTTPAEFGSPLERRPRGLKLIETAAIEIGRRIDNVQFLGLRLTDFFAGMGFSWATRNIAKIALFSLTGGASIPTAALAGGAGGAISGATKEYLKQVRGNVKEAHALELTPRKLKLKEKLKTLRPNNKGALVKATGTGLVAGMAGGIVGSYVLEYGGEWINYLKHIGENRSGGAMIPTTLTSTATEFAPSPTKTPLIPLTETPKASPTYTPSPKASPAEITSATPTRTAIPTGTATATLIASPTETALPTPPKEITPPAGGTPINSSRLEEVQQLFKDPDKNPAAAAVGAHLEISSDIVNKALAESNIDPHSVSDEAREKMRLAVQHKMEGWSNDNFEIIAQTAPPNESLDNVLREARTQVDNSWNKTDVIKHLKAGALDELNQQTAVQKTIIEQINSHLTPDSFTDVTANPGTNAGQLLVAHGHQITWGPADADILGTHVAANYDSLVNTWSQMAANGNLPENKHFPIALWDLDSIIRKAKAGDPDALQKLKDALHWIPAGKTFRILNDTGIKIAMENDSYK